MNTYQVTPANNTTKTQAHVKELNANVCTATFPSPTGLKGRHYASLYKQDGGCNTLVYYYYDCAPVNSTLIDTVIIDFGK